ncbi:hypothetical protein BD779DRAFT_851725 [Infundibulicybe gibba]|nr:hypothetical protein BD779DRAFT_851725 [Infundibulicybe gibba]
MSSARIPSIPPMFWDWATPRKIVLHLLERRNYSDWETFRDSLVNKWTNLNVLGGLIMGGISTVIFSGLSLSNKAFTFGVVALLSSLISIGFGVGLIYVLGDVSGPRLHHIGTTYPNLFLFSISIPQTWATMSFVTFFLCVCFIVWEAENKGWVVRVWRDIPLPRLHIYFARQRDRESRIGRTGLIGSGQD